MVVAGAMLLMLAALVFASMFRSDSAAVAESPVISQAAATVLPATSVASPRDEVPAPAAPADPAPTATAAVDLPVAASVPVAATTAVASPAPPSSPAPSPVAVNNSSPAAGAAPAEKVQGATYGPWIQDFEEAKRRAAAEGKDILVVFSGLDWCEWSVRSRREVFGRPDFSRGVSDRYILVEIDFPLGPQQQANVQDQARNQRLAEQFAVTNYPTVVLTDAQGLPYGAENYVPGGVSAFQSRLRRYRSVREQRDRVFGRLASANGAEKLEAVREAVELLLEHDLLTFYGERLRDWTQVVLAHDPRNERGVYELVFQGRWMGQLLSLSDDNRQGLVQLAAALDKWESQCDFQDGDRGAVLHLLAGLSLLQAGKQHHADAVRHFQAGRDCEPEEEQLALQLEMFASLGEGQVAGTGFVVSPQGYVLTNHHVIDGAGDMAVQLEGQEPMPAEVVAQDPERDLALLRVQAPRGAKLPPVTFAEDARRGQEVAAFGYPLGVRSLILTRGNVSGQTPDGYALLDCRVNPGNSGGPLCDAAGRVVGVVSAKSRSSDTVESYGLAIPSATAYEFLAKTLPGGAPRAAARSARNLGWEEVNDRVAPSVVMIVRSLAPSGFEGESLHRRRPHSSTLADRKRVLPPDVLIQPASSSESSPTPSVAPATASKPRIPQAPKVEQYAPTGEMTLLNLAPHFTKNLNEGTPRYPSNNWVSLPRGEQTFGGVKFQVGEGMIQLSSETQWRDCPEQIEIPLGKKFTNLYLLHATQGYLTGPGVVGAVVFRYADGSQVQHELHYERHVADGWLRWAPRPLPEAVLAWVGDNPTTTQIGVRLSLYATQFVNPHPEREVAAIVYATTNNQMCAPFCVAMTLEGGPKASRPAHAAPAAVAASPASAAANPRFLDRGDYLEDTKTGLLWQKDGDASGTLNYYQAKRYAADLNLGGHSGWRVPTRDELKEIFPAAEAPFTDTRYTENPQDGSEMSSYWTSELDTRREDFAYLYHWYGHGGANNCFASSNHAFVRCVHDPIAK
jgi:S1-C subfamily serine protease